MLSLFIDKIFKYNYICFQQFFQYILYLLPNKTNTNLKIENVVNSVILLKIIIKDTKNKLIL